MKSRSNKRCATFTVCSSWCCSDAMLYIKVWRQTKYLLLEDIVLTTHGQILDILWHKSKLLHCLLVQLRFFLVFFLFDVKIHKGDSQRQLECIRNTYGLDVRLFWAIHAHAHVNDTQHLYRSVTVAPLCNIAQTNEYSCHLHSISFACMFHKKPGYQRRNLIWPI